MEYGIFKNEGTIIGANSNTRKCVGHRIWSAVTFPTVAAARSEWYDADMGNGNQMLILPANTAEYSYYPKLGATAH